MYDFEEINSILADLADRDIVESIAEPCDFSDAHPLDWAEAAGLVDEIFDEMYPEVDMIDEYGNVWYVS